MENTALISIIIPIYNVENYIRKCLDSIKEQTLENIEIICIDDGSTDNSLDIVKEYAQNDNRFKYITQKNQGPGITRNNGLKIATGNYIMFVDPDDYIEKEATEKLYKTFEKTGVDVIQFNYFECRLNGKIKKVDYIKRFKEEFNIDIIENPYFNMSNLKPMCFNALGASCWQKAYSKNFLLKNNILFPEGKHGEDHLFANKVLLNSSQIYYLNEYLYYYQVRLSSLVNSISDENFCIFDYISELENYLKEKNLLEELNYEFLQYKITALSLHYRAIPQNSIQKYKEMAKNILSESDYKEMINIATCKNTFAENIFSIKNYYQGNTKAKKITVLGISIKLKTKK